MVYTAAFVITFCALLCPGLLASRASVLAELFPPNGLCELTAEETEAVLLSIHDTVDNMNAFLVVIPECGDGLWRSIADIDVSGNDTSCPSGWEFANTPRIGCTKPDNDVGGCALASFSTAGVEYDQVCGRVTGRTADTPNGFRPTNNNNDNLVDGITLVDGLTVTYSSPIRHIWTFSAHFNPSMDRFSCPCNPNVNNINMLAVNFANGSYFCDYSRPNENRPLWTGDCGDLMTTVPECCNPNGPPYFSATLDEPTTENVDVRICTNVNSPESVYVESMELFIQ